MLVIVAIKCLIFNIKYCNCCFEYCNCCFEYIKVLIYGFMDLYGLFVYYYI